MECDNQLRCPACGNDYNRIAKVKLYSGNDEYVSNMIEVAEFTDHLYAKSVPVDTDNRNRNLSLDTLFECESGHTWIRKTRFHKGGVYDAIVSCD